MGNRRIVEWSVMVLVVLATAGVLGREFRIVQGQGELAAIKTTLGALRTALVIDHLKNNAIDHKPAAQTERNPFLLLDHTPGNYAGLLASLKGQPLPQGSWIYDTYCNCIGYEPMFPRALDHTADSPTVWFRISAPPGPLQITPAQKYVWQGEVLN